VSDSNSIAVLEPTSLTVYEADIFNCSRHPLKSTGQLDSAHSRDQPVHRPARETLCLVPTWRAGCFQRRSRHERF
jgi:hypothetical protein